MTLRNLLKAVYGFGETYCLAADLNDNGELVAAHPNPNCPVDVRIVEGLELLEEVPPEVPVRVTILGRLRDGFVEGRVVESQCSEAENVAVDTDEIDG